MDTRRFLAASRVLIVAGKGGVGKSTVACAVARIAAGLGLDVALVETDGKPLPSGIPAQVRTLALQPGEALTDYLSNHGLARVTRQLVTSGITDLVASAAPGIDDLLVLGKIKHMERDDSHDLIVVDGPAAGHALDMLRAPRQLRAAVVGGPVRRQADEVGEMLRDPTRCRVMLVTSPETTPVSEMIDTAASLRDELSVTLTPLVVNGVDRNGPPDDSPGGIATLMALATTDELRRAAEFRIARRETQHRAMAALASRFPMPQLIVPRLDTAFGTPDGHDSLVGAVAEALTSSFEGCTDV